MDELKPCPNTKCQSTRVALEHDYATYWVSCFDCGMTGPSCGCANGEPETSKAYAIASWNALPRAQQWTEYNGTEGPLPPEYMDVVVITGGQLPDSMCKRVGNKWIEEMSGVTWSHVAKGDRWLPWPGDEQ